jgi:hypothetical protein
MSKPQATPREAACSSLSPAADRFDPHAGMSTPMRRIRSGCCARTTTGHAAALLSPAMNSRRRIRHPLKLLCGQPIAVRVAWERVASGPGANLLRRFLQRLRRLLAQAV